MEGVAIVTAPHTPTLAGEGVQEAIARRLHGSPLNPRHRAHAVVPWRVAAALAAAPGLLGQAVAAFTERQPEDAKVLLRMRHFPPETCVRTCVVFPRPLYALVTSRPFAPDPRVGWPAPVSPAHLLGVKLACGFELLAAQADASSPESSGRELLRVLGR